MKKFISIYFIALSLGLLAQSCSKKDPVSEKEEPTVTPPKEEPQTGTPPTSYVPGNKYRSYVADPNGSGTTYVGVEYIAGDNESKLIITAPHGGGTSPAYMRTRTSTYSYGTLPTDPYNNDKSFSATEDLNTKDFAEEIAAAVKEKTGLRPHVILNYLHRRKLDANRRMEVAAQGDKNAEDSWKAFQSYIDDAKKTVSYYHQSGLLIDVHGNGHSPQRTEVGYLIDKDDFTKYANALGTLTNNTSIKGMVNANVSLTSLITGDYALGTLINEKVGVKATPSKAYPEPGDKTAFSDGLYFEGGYITARHGSKQGGKISAIQLEFNSSIRSSDNTRPTYAVQVADAIKTFMDRYFGN